MLGSPDRGCGNRTCTAVGIGVAVEAGGDDHLAVLGRQHRVGAGHSLHFVDPETFARLVNCGASAERERRNAEQQQAIDTDADTERRLNVEAEMRAVGQMAIARFRALSVAPDGILITFPWGHACGTAEQIRECWVLERPYSSISDDLGISSRPGWVLTADSHLAAANFDNCLSLDRRSAKSLERLQRQVDVPTLRHDRQQGTLRGAEFIAVRVGAYAERNGVAL